MRACIDLVLLCATPVLVLLFFGRFSGGRARLQRDRRVARESFEEFRHTLPLGGNQFISFFQRPNALFPILVVERRRVRVTLMQLFC
ncbi:hypothetical protein Bxe_B2286 [Paraburkholderia xenovorans LB400]|jgi:hypothetical protein|uniref:Uncharacterized protein n=1 Tax=Paraburkholderia xenovorans (strain LB400) TaxID=266265 RepID=Q13QD9_PARXL|nr:hypothetical protein Bxe_B2286 [Paraburkholderia xenovorans LB400]